MDQPCSVANGDHRVKKMTFELLHPVMKRDEFGCEMATDNEGK